MARNQHSGGASRGGGAAGAVREEPASVGESAAGAAGDIAQTTKEQGREVAAEARRQARDLAQETRTGIREQATAQRDRAVGGLRALGEELEQMADRGQSGMASEVARQVAERTRQVAGFLESREPGDLVEEVRDYARRRPGTFLLGAALAGVVAGRMTKAMRARSQPQDTTGGDDGSADWAESQGIAAYTAAGMPEGTSPAGYAAAGTQPPPVRPAMSPGYAEPGYGQAPYGGPAESGEPPGAGPSDVTAPGRAMDPAYAGERPPEGVDDTTYAIDRERAGRGRRP